MSDLTGEVLLLHGGQTYTATYRIDDHVLHVSSSHGWKAARAEGTDANAQAKQLLREIVLR